MSSNNIENNKKAKDRDEITGSILRVEEIVKHGKPKLKKKLVTIDTNVPNATTDRTCKKARNTAHSLKANIRRKISTEARKALDM